MNMSLYMNMRSIFRKIVIVGQTLFTRKSIPSVLWEQNVKVKVPKHDSRGVEQMAKTLFGHSHMASFPVNSPRVIVTVADTRRSPANIVLFRSFSPRLPETLREQMDYLDPEKILIWKAARCTSAAPFYFNSYNGLSDGGLVANNPTQVLIADFLQTTRLEQQYSPNKEVGQDPSIACVVSIGTGLNPTKKNPLQIARGFITVINNAKKIIQILLRECFIHGVGKYELNQLAEFLLMKSTTTDSHCKIASSTVEKMRTDSMQD
ncbi:phospholipase, patatin family [Dictyocaulus viviparus]|uniref:Phospholipase, patatin family n=1 Tax=Dictyocaulus viviparus TaxID=29172 RepID=A0A0D8XFS9_DICVI|nr:phospholipase, patatin family [Dictyocaulus viviparus]